MPPTRGAQQEAWGALVARLVARGGCIHEGVSMGWGDGGA